MFGYAANYKRQNEKNSSDVLKWKLVITLRTKDPTCLRERSFKKRKKFKISTIHKINKYAVIKKENQ